MKRWPACSGLWLALLMGACSTAPPEHFYTLSPTAPATATPGSQGISIAIGSATLIDLVDRPQLVTRLGENRVAIFDVPLLDLDHGRDCAIGRQPTL